MIYTANKGQDIYGIPLGIIVMDCLIPYPPGTPGYAGTFSHPVLYSTVRGADMENLIYEPKPELEEKFVAAGHELVQQGVQAIVGNCGFMVFFQKRMAQEFDVPVYMSGLLQLPLISRGLKPNQKIGIISASGESLKPRHMQIACGDHTVETVIRGLENKPSFKAAIHDQAGSLDFEKVESEIVETALEIQKRETDIGAILLECTDLPPYARAVQDATGLPVFDITTMISFVVSGIRRRRFTE